MTISLFDRVENSVGKGENADYLFPFPTVFSKVFFFKVDKSRDCLVKSLKNKGMVDLQRKTISPVKIELKVKQIPTETFLRFS